MGHKLHHQALGSGEKESASQAINTFAVFQLACSRGIDGSDSTLSPAGHIEWFAAKRQIRG
jgi:hypothetical protein